MDNWFNETTVLEIGLSYNRIMSLDKFAFNGVRRLDSINLNYNQIHFIEVGTFINIPSIHLVGNSLYNIDFLRSATIDLLDIGFNKISGVRIPQATKIQRLLIYPNPWNCECLRNFWKYAWSHNISIDASFEFIEEDPLCIRGQGIFRRFNFPV